MEKKAKVPKLRFPGFAGDWEERKLGEIAECLDNMRIPINAEEREKIPGSIPYYGAGNIQGYIDKYLFDEELVLLLEDGDAFDDFRTKSIAQYVKGKSWINNHAHVLRPKGNGYFLFCILEHKDIRSATQLAGASRKKLVQSAMMNINVIMPLVSEQQKIGNFFKSLDNLITLHQRKLTHLQVKKKSLLQKMFPKKGERVPEIRFPGFAGDWEQRKLGEVLDDLYNGQTPSRNKKSFWGGEINWLSSGELNCSIIKNTNEKITLDGQKDANLRIVPEGTFIMAITGLEAAGTRGNCGILGLNTTLNQSCMALFPNQKLLDTLFLFQWYRMVGEDYGIRFTQGTKQQSYNAEIIKMLDIALPKIGEQVEIARVLNRFDDLITLHQRKLTHLQTQKKALLQQMFV